MLKIREEAARCLLCADGACTKVCPQGFDPARMIRAVRFENEACAGIFTDAAKCAECDGACEKACVHYDFPVRIRDMAAQLPKPVEYSSEPDLSIEFCGVRCENPFFLSSSIVAGDYDMVARAFEAGWGGAVFKTVGFLIPEEVSPRFGAIGKEGTPFIGFKNLEQISDHPLEYNLGVFRRLKANYPRKVLVASIMGQNDEEWVQLSKLVTEAGADIIECNFSCPHMSGSGLGSDVGQDPALVNRYTELVKSATHLPVLAKMTPNIGNMEVPAIAAVEAGADGIAAINTIKSILGINTDTLESSPSVGGKCSVSGYSGKAVKPIALRFIHDLAKCPQLSQMQLSGMGGIETWHDALEFILLGCRNIQVTTAVMQYGYRIIDDLITGTKAYMQSHGIKSISELVGAALPNMVPADMLDRSTVVVPSFDSVKCLGCGRCYLSCRDAGHQAISLTDGKAKLNASKCVGCHLCMLVCPSGAITDKTKRIKKPKRG
ncbi:MAG: NAD-dependent dihydropyrimidine dehydrogenase subunit PreA [Ruminiclostridium sp.]|nr:NAD-dependent dihydropyrimidine dehydrogenase subunit PreA [Ruminiclostridium sp.]